MNKEEYLRKLKVELSYLTSAELKKELECYEKFFESERGHNVSVEKSIESLGSPKELAKKIYLKRGIDSTKLRKNIINNITDSIMGINSAFKSKKNDKKKMVIDLVYLFVLIILVKFPFDLIRDIGFSYLDILTPGSIYETIWEILFLVIYTITAICTFVVLARNFNKKYLN